MSVVRLPDLAGTAATDTLPEAVFHLNTEETIAGITVLGRPEPSNDLILIQHAKK
jgi:hypothetical protein